MTTATLEREIDTLSPVDLRRIFDYVAAKLRETEEDPYPDEPISFDQLNDETLEAFREIEEGGGKRFKTTAELFAYLES